MPTYHYRINLTRDKDIVDYESQWIDGISPCELPKALYSAIGKFTDTYLEEFRKNKDCPNTLDVKLIFPL